MSDFSNSVVNVYAGRFAGQAPCGQIASGLNAPAGLYGNPRTHDLYVANMQGFDVVVFHRGQLTPYNNYTDPTGQYSNDVTVARDGTVVASNSSNTAFTEAGSISTWIGGPNGGTFVGNFPMTDGLAGGFVTVQKNGTVFYNDAGDLGVGYLWSMSCPAGACGAQTQVAGVSFIQGGGMASDAAEDLLVNEQTSNAGTADTFELPHPRPSTFPLSNGQPVGMAINELDHHWFVADENRNEGFEYSYPSGKFIGSVPGNPGCVPIGIAVDPGHALR